MTDTPNEPIIRMIERLCNDLGGEPKDPERLLVCHCRAIARLLDASHPNDVSECHRETLKALLGPHGKTLFHVLKVRRAIGCVEIKTS